MRRAFALFVVILCLTWRVEAVAQEYIVNPDEFSEELISLIAKKQLREFAQRLAAATGKPPESATQIESALKIFEQGNLDYRKKVVDNLIAGALRQIIHYAYIPGVGDGFVYFRFNFKMSSKGWLTRNFIFATQLKICFPAATPSPTRTSFITDGAEVRQQMSQPPCG